MAISDKIKQHRKNCKLTQKQLAEKLGVSPQAVSKWESGAGAPDISLIVPLAKALNISSDELLEYKDNLSKLTGEWIEKRRLCKTGQMPWSKLVEFDKVALKQNHMEGVLLLRLAEDMYKAAMETDELKLREDRLRWSVHYVHTYLERYPEDDYARSVYVEILVAQGRRSEAFEQADMCKDKDRVMELCLQGEDLKLHIQNVVSKKFYSFLWSLHRQELDFLDAEERVLKAVINDGNYQHFHGTLMMIEYKRACCYGAKGEKEKALECLRKAIDFAKKRDEEQYGKLTVPIFDVIPGEPEDMPSYSHQLYVHLEAVNSDLSVIYGTPEYEKLLGECKELAGKWQINELTTRIPIVANENMGEQQTTVLITSMLNTVITKDDFTGEVCEKLKKAGTTKILKTITIWKTGEIDLPSYDFRKALVEMDKANYGTEILMSNGNKKLENTLAKKDVEI